MKIVQGDLIALALNGHFDVIVHGCNCDCIMGAGIAQSIRKHFPEAYAADAATKVGDSAKLGSYSMAVCVRGSIQITVVNGYTQMHPSGSGVLADYHAIRIVMRALKRDFAGRRITILIAW